LPEFGNNLTRTEHRSGFWAKKLVSALLYFVQREQKLGAMTCSTEKQSKGEIRITS